MHKTLKLLAHAALIGAGAAVAALQSGGFANEFGGAAFVVAGVLGIAAEAIDKAEDDTDL